MPRYGWRPDLPDRRDFVFMAAPRPGLIPEKMDLRAECPPIYDQGQLGSCTGNAIAAALQFDQLKQGEPSSNPSRLFIYYNERAMEGTVESDAGAMIRDGIKSVAKLGCCPESMWPYDISKFRDKPTASAYGVAATHRAIEYRRVSGLEGIQACLADGYPVVFGFTVHEAFESPEVAKTGIVPFPKRGERALGGHAVLAVGYDMPSHTLIVRNSWGLLWGQKGYFILPEEYITYKLASDFWTIRTIQ